MKIPEGWPTEDMVAAGFEVIRADAPNEREFRIMLFQAMLAAAPTPTPPAQEDEPVAWMVPRIVTYSLDFDKVVGWEASVFCDSQKQARIDGKGNVYYPYPLYTRPQSDKLREVAEEIEKRLRNAGLDHDADFLRAALEGK